MKIFKILVLAFAFISAPTMMNSCKSTKDVKLVKPKKGVPKVKSKGRMGNPKDRNNGIWGQ